MNDQKQQVAERVKEANNILVTVSANPSVDQLAACIGLTLTLNKMGKHATAVFSGEVPSTIKFLQPEKTIEKNTDSLRDFIIALDKSKADKLRYKVEDKVVKIFITPYKTSISEKDLEFSQGDFNVDVVLALGVHNQADLDQAITAHGRILHDATVVTINDKPGGEIGSINWLDPMASSLSELAVQLVDMLDKSLLDGQIATAMLTGIVAETERFSNSKTSPRTMTISAELMTAGANQQLVATKLEAPAPPQPAPAAVRPIAEVPQEMVATAAAAPKANDGTLEIKHEEKPAPSVPAPVFDEPKAQEPLPPEPTVEKPAEIELPEPPKSEEKPEEPKPEPQPEPVVDEPEPEVATIEAKPPQINIDEHGSLSLPGSDDDLGSLPPLEKKAPPSISHHAEGPKMILQPPTLGGELTANTKTEDAYESSADPLAGGLPSLEVPVEPEVHTTQPGDPAPVGMTIQPPELPQSAPATVAPSPEPIQESSSEFMLPSSDPYAPQASQSAAVRDDETLSQIEQDVHSSHLTETNAQPEQPPVVTVPQPPVLPDPSPVPPPANAAFGTPGPMPPAYPPYQPPSMNEPTTLQDANAAFASAAAPSPEPVTPPTDEETAVADLQSARDAVMQAINSGTGSDEPQPPAAPADAQPIDLPALHHEPEAPAATPASNGVVPAWNPAPAPAAPAPAPFQPAYNDANPMAGQAMPGLPGMMPQPFDPAAQQGQVNDPNAPPPVPPPMMPPNFQ